MSKFNRVAVVVSCLAVLALAMIVLLVTTEVITPAFLPSDWFDELAQKAIDSTGGTRAALIAIAVVLAVVALALSILELVPIRRRRLLLVSSNQAGITTIEQDSVRLLAEKTAASVRAVRHVHCTVREGINGLIISSRASVGLGNSIPEVSGELRTRIKESVEQFTGLPVVEVDVKAQYEPTEARHLTVS